jgi:hypothetical protein
MILLIKLKSLTWYRDADKIIKIKFLKSILKSYGKRKAFFIITKNCLLLR